MLSINNEIDHVKQKGEAYIVITGFLFRHCRLPFVIAGLTGNLEGERCPIGVGHDEEEERAWYHIVIAGLTGNLRCPIGSGMTGT